MISNGSELNQKDAYGGTATIRAIQRNDIQMSFYFIVELQANVRDVYYSRESLTWNTETPTPHYPVELLRWDWNFPLDSEEYQIKMEIVKEFERQGVDYWSTPIPDDVIQWAKNVYPNTWEEYLEKY